MSTPEEIAAALQRIAAWKRGVDWDLLSTGQMIDDIEALLLNLRAANPPAEAERATEPEPFDVMRAWCRMYENHSDADRAMNRKDSFTAQDHAMRVFLRERFGL